VLFWGVTRRRLVAGYRRFGIPSVPSSRAKQPKNTLEYGTGRLYRNDGNYQPTLRNIAEEGRPQIHRGGKLKSRVFIAYFVNFVDDVSCLDCTQPRWRGGGAPTSPYLRDLAPTPPPCTLYTPYTRMYN
jgi:hypothetical protein